MARDCAQTKEPKQICCVDLIPPWAINQKILPGPNRVNSIFLSFLMGSMVHLKILIY